MFGLREVVRGSTILLSLLAKGTGVVAAATCSGAQNFGFDHGWPSENGWFVSAAYKYPNYTSLEQCAEKCQEKGTPGGSWGYDYDNTTCFCEESVTCVEPYIIERGGCVFSTVSNPGGCEETFCDTFGNKSRSYCDRKDFEKRNKPLSRSTSAATTRFFSSYIIGGVSLVSYLMVHDLG